jgi:lysozyme
MCPARIWTVGYGRALRHPSTGKFLKEEKDKALAYSLYPNLTEAEANIMLKVDIAEFEMEVYKLVKVPTLDYEYDAMVSLAYNIGIGQFRKSTMLLYHNQNKKSLAATRFAPFNKTTINGKLVIQKGLVARRKTENLLYTSGKLKFFN